MCNTEYLLNDITELASIMSEQEIIEPMNI